MVDEIREDRDYMERLEKKCSDLTSLVAAAEGSRDRLQAESHQQAGKITRLMEAARTAESDLARCSKELATTPQVSTALVNVAAQLRREVSALFDLVPEVVDQLAEGEGQVLRAGGKS